MAITPNKKLADILIKMSKEEISFLANIAEESSVTTRLLDTAPLPYQLYGNVKGYNGKAVFTYVEPLMAWGTGTNTTTQLGNGKLTGFGATDKIPKEFLENGKITEQTTKWAIGQVADGKMTSGECNAIIRQRNGLTQTNATYTLPLPIPNDNSAIPPLAWNPNTKEGTYSVSLGSTDAQEHIKALYRAQKIADEIERFSAKVEQGLKNGTYTKKYDDNGNEIICEEVPNPYYEQHKKDIKIRYDGSRDPAFPEEVIPTTITRRVTPNLGKFLSEELYTNEQIALTTSFLDLTLAGTDTNGNKIKGEGYGLSNESIQEAIAGSPPAEKKSTIGGALYGAKYYVYGAFFTSFFGLSLLSGLRSKYGVLGRVFGNWTKKSVISFLEGPLELGLTGFKVTKDVTTSDVGRLVRDIAVNRIGHHLAHSGLVDTLTLTLRGTIITIPWFGWALAAASILYDITAPIIAENIEKNEQYFRYREACEIKKNNGSKTIQDPGLALHGIKKTLPILIDDKGNLKNRNKGLPIGVTKDKNGNLIPIYSEEPVATPTRVPGGGGFPYVGFNTINEKQIQAEIESRYFQENIVNNIITDDLSNSQYNPQDSNSIPEPPPSTPEPNSDYGEILPERYGDTGDYSIISESSFSDYYRSNQSEYDISSPLKPNPSPTDEPDGPTGDSNATIYQV